jgi:3-hydroxyacyl-[acyl-carrier-protein] dehydratase
MSESENTRGPLDIRRILALIPHRYPMLLVDRVVSMELNQSIHAVKAVTMNEPFFQGHFPGRPIMPGVMIVEAMAQAAAILAIESLGLADANKLVYFMAIDGAKFRKPVEPGCLLDLHVQIVQNKRTICRFAGQAMIDGALAAECSFTAMIADPPAA